MFLFLFFIESGVFCQPSGINSFVEFAFVVAVGDVGFEDVAVAGFEFAIDGAFLNCAGANVVTQYAEQQRIGRFEVIEKGDELVEVFAEERVGLSFTHLVATEILLAGLFPMTISEVGPMLPGVMQGFIVFDNQYGSFVWRQLHY